MAEHDTGVHNLVDHKAFREATGKDGVMVIDCYADWCGPCKMIAPKVVEFAKKYPDVRFYKVDVDGVPDIAQELSIRAMPTFKIFKGGELEDTVVGASAPDLEKAIKKAAGID